jgi:hypothetical protein
MGINFESLWWPICTLGLLLVTYHYKEINNELERVWKWSWPNCRHYPLCFPRGANENNEKAQSGKLSLSRYLDQGPSEQKTQVLTIKPQDSVTPNLHNAIKPDKIPMTCNINISRILKKKLKLKACTLQMYFCNHLITLHTDSYHRDLCSVPWNSCDSLVDKLAQN